MKKKLMILTGALVFALALSVNLQYAFDNYGIGNNNMYTEAIAQTTSSCIWISDYGNPVLSCKDGNGNYSNLIMRFDASALLLKCEYAQNITCHVPTQG